MIQFNKQLYLVRHGEVDFNKKGIMIGTIDQSLNETGRKQAKKITESVKGLSIDVLISSNLKRTAETAEIISKATGWPLKIDPIFRERNYGAIEGKKKEDLKKIYPQCVNESGKFIPENEFPDAEPLDDFYQRIINGIRNLLEKYPDKKIMLVTHAGILRAIYAYVNNIPLNKVREVYNPEEVNCLIENY